MDALRLYPVVSRKSIWGNALVSIPYIGCTFFIQVNEADKLESESEMAF